MKRLASGDLGSVTGLWLIALAVAPGCGSPGASEEDPQFASAEQAALVFPTCVPPTVLRCTQPPPGNKIGSCFCFNPTPSPHTPDTNLALGRRPFQSSTLFDATADRTTDGNTDGNFWAGSVNHTDAGLKYNPGLPEAVGQWWYMDLGAEKTVNAVNIFNRTDCCTERLSHYNILAFNSTRGVWNIISSHATDETGGISFFHWPFSPPVKTQYVVIAKTDDNFLHLAEVEVMGF